MDNLQLDNSNDYEIGSPDAAYNQKSRYNQNNNFNQTISGKANRIGAFKKSFDQEKQQYDVRDRSKDKELNSGTFIKQRDSDNGAYNREPDIEDLNSPTTAHNLKAQNHEQDVAFAVNNLNEIEQVVDLVHNFEENFTQAKKMMNGLCLASLESDITAQTLNSCYQIVHGFMQLENTNFDKENMQIKIQTAHEKIKNCNFDYSQLKGEFFAVNEPIINKDIFSFKLERVQKYANRQQDILEKLPEFDSLIKDYSNQLQILKKSYENFELNILKQKVQDTSIVIKDTEQLMKKITQQQEKLQQVIIQATERFQQIAPQTKEQKAKQQKILTDIYAAQKKLETSQSQLMNEINQKESFYARHQDCEKIISQTKLPNALKDMVNQSRKLQKIIENYKRWVEMYKRLKELMEETLNQLEFDLTKAIQDGQKYQDQVSNEKKEEYDDLLRKIQKNGKKISEDVDDQSKRLNNFEKKLIEPQGNNDFIADTDLYFLKKQIARFKSNLVSTKSMTLEIIDDSVRVREESIQSQQGITIEDLQQLRANMKVLQKQDETDMPRIKDNIDKLEGYSIKSLKNQLNEDNKKSQNLISKMKKNYEDLQKYIDQLNNKIGKTAQQINGLKEQFMNEDLERENEINLRIYNKLEQCEAEVNGDKEENLLNQNSLEEQLNSQKNLSLQARKKAIILNINKMVNQFNENNKLIKESNKNQKNEREIVDLIQKNKEIQLDCQKIEEKVGLAKSFANQINDRLDTILNPTSLEIKEKYLQKNQLIDECDENFDKVNATIKKQEDLLEEKLAVLIKIMDRLDSVSPINQPQTNNKFNKEFAKEVNEKIDAAQKLRDDLENKLDKIQQTRDFLLNLVQPLNELGERQIKSAEIEHILQELIDLWKDLQELDKEIQLKLNILDKLKIDVDSMLEKDKFNKIYQAENLLNELDNKIDEIGVQREEAYQKLSEYKQLIQQAKLQKNKDDPEMIGQLKRHENEVKNKEKELSDLDIRWNDLKKSRNDSKKLLDDIKNNPQKYSYQQIDELLLNLQDQLEKCKDLNNKYKEFEGEQLDLIKQLQDLLDNSLNKKQLSDEASQLLKQIEEDLQQFKGVMDQLPKQIDLLLQTLQEMKIGSEPDDNADYWDERKTIDKQISNLKQIKQNLGQFQKLYEKKKLEFQQQSQNYKRISDLEALKLTLKEIKGIASELEDQLNQAFDARDEVAQIKKDMSDCNIPVNIEMRRNEINSFNERLERIKADFKDMKSADDNFQGDSKTEKEIKDLMQKIDQKLRGFDQENREFQRYQSQKLENYKEPDYLNLNNFTIIVEVRDFKAKIHDANIRLNELEEMMNELNNKLIQQDMDNASILLTKKVNKLRERLMVAEKVLKKITKCGQEMDGNTTHQEEDEFIDALKDEMPEVFKNIDMNFDQIDDIEKLLKQVIETRNIQKMADLKKEISEASVKVEQSEALVLKLENEIIEWNAFKKVCRRDEELGEIESLVNEFKEDLQTEEKLMEVELQKSNQKIDKSGNTSDLMRIQNEVQNYLTDIDDLARVVDDLKKERDECFQQFDADVPKNVKIDRQKRPQNDLASSNQKNKPNMKKPPIPNESNQPSDIYYLIEINCRYRKRIHDMLKQLRLINQRRKELEEKYGPLKSELSAVQKQNKQAYKFVKGDEIDELFAYHLNKAGCNLLVKRIQPGKYLFGTKQIMAKIINGKLVIRVGGGYMSADEFIEQYGKMEMMKMMRQEELNNQSEAGNGKDFVPDNSKRSSSGRLPGGAATMGEAKDMLRASLFSNIKTYEKTNDDGGFNSGFQSRGSTKVSNANIKDIDDKYDMAKFGQQKSPPPQRINKLDSSPKRGSDIQLNRATSADKNSLLNKLASPKARR